MTGAPVWSAWDAGVPPGTTARDLAEGVERTTTELVEAAARVPAEAMTRPGTFDLWSAKDALAHCLAWSEICARALSEIVDGTFDPRRYDELDDDEDELNQRQVTQMGGISVEVILDRLTKAGASAADSLRALDGDPQAQLVYMTVVDHFPEHAAELRALWADPA